MKNMNYSVISVVGFSLIFNAVLVSTQSLAIDCGAKGGKDEDGRTWVEDAKYLSKSENSVQIQAGYQDPSLLSTVPYMSARIFPSPATYKFSIQAKQRYLVRFHFYPSTYQSFNVSKSFFEVTAGAVKLMSNFSASITCQALTQAYVIKEYSLAPSESETLEITFTPSANHSDTFAFVNGIELIEMPNLFGMMKMVGYDNPLGANLVDASSENLETMFRLNLNDEKKSLAGKNPDPSAMMIRTENDPRSFSKTGDDYVVVGATGGAAAAFVVVALVVFFYTKKRKVDGVESHTASWLPVYGNSHVGGSKSSSNHLASLAQETADGMKSRLNLAGEQGSNHSRDDSSVGHRREPSGRSVGNELELNEGKDESAIFSQLANPTGR
ncbi:hypothetical protein V6N13_067649 [Hibiscus sabdariffa]